MVEGAKASAAAVAVLADENALNLGQCKRDFSVVSHDETFFKGRPDVRTIMTQTASAWHFRSSSRCQSDQLFLIVIDEETKLGVECLSLEGLSNLEPML
jgi:hypothetical protein